VPVIDVYYSGATVPWRQEVAVARHDADDRPRERGRRGGSRGRRVVAAAVGRRGGGGMVACSLGRVGCVVRCSAGDGVEAVHLGRRVAHGSESSAVHT